MPLGGSASVKRPKRMQQSIDRGQPEAGYLGIRVCTSAVLSDLEDIVGHATAADECGAVSTVKARG